MSQQTSTYCTLLLFFWSAGENMRAGASWCALHGSQGQAPSNWEWSSCSFQTHFVLFLLHLQRFITPFLLPIMLGTLSLPASSGEFMTTRHSLAPEVLTTSWNASCLGPGRIWKQALFCRAIADFAFHWCLRRIILSGEGAVCVWRWWELWLQGCAGSAVRGQAAPTAASLLEGEPNKPAVRWSLVSLKQR